MTQHDLVAGDRGSALIVTLRDSETDELIDLTGKTATLRYAVNGGGTVEKSMTVLDQVSRKGQAQYQFLSTDLTAAGTIKGEVRLQAGQSDQVTTIDDLYVSVKGPLP